MPRYDDTNENKHGTRCAGEVAAVANNSVCSVGVAFNAGIGGIRMLDGDVTDSVEAASLAHNSQHIAIYSASWGPDDNGEVVDGPGPLAKKAFVDGALTGRNGLGSVYVWASGNGGRFNDSCACDGYANSIYTLSISSTSERSEKPWYLEECASTLATTYSSGDERGGENEIITTDLRHKCTAKHTGTSAAAPLAAGIIALALEANPRLSWRDIMFLTVLTSRPQAIKSNNYIVNKRGFAVSSRYGFGLMDAGRMVELGKTWRPVPVMQSCSTLNSNFKT
jgi:subtilisin family serine protease